MTAKKTLRLRRCRVAITLLAGAVCIYAVAITSLGFLIVGVILCVAALVVRFCEVSSINAEIRQHFNRPMDTHMPETTS